MNTADTPKSNGKPKPVKTGDAHLDRRELLAALRALRRGELEVKMREDLSGVDGQIAETFNDLVGMVRTIKEEAHEVCHAVGKEGQAAKRALDTLKSAHGASGDKKPGA